MILEGCYGRFAACLLGLVLVGGCEKKKEPAPTPDVHDPIRLNRAPATELEGVWTVIESIDKGTRDPEDKIKNSEISFEGNLIFVREGDKVSAHTSFQIDSTKQPKTIDMTYNDGPHVGKVDYGIYALEGNVLKICMNEQSGGERPKKFASPPGTTFSLLTLKCVE